MQRVWEKLKSFSIPVFTLSSYLSAAFSLSLSILFYLSFPLHQFPLNCVLLHTFFWSFQTWVSAFIPTASLPFICPIVISLSSVFLQSPSRFLGLYKDTIISLLFKSKPSTWCEIELDGRVHVWNYDSSQIFGWLVSVSFHPL